MQQHGTESSLNLLSTPSSTMADNESSLQDDHRQHYSNSATMEDTRQDVEEQLHELLQVLFELAVMVYDFQPDGNKLVWNKM
jgi:mediator of RNA polymerase II transcription subunit 10